MRQKRRILNSYIVGALAIAVVVAAAVATLGTKHRPVDASPATKLASKTSPVKSQFSFAGTTGWHAGPANRTSMALFSDDGECFTSIEHKPGTVDTAAQIQKQQADLTTTGGTMTASATPTVTVQLATGIRQYELHEFSLSNDNKSQPLMGGLGLGYVQLPNGYLKIQSHCNTASELPAAILALQAYTFTS